MLRRQVLKLRNSKRQRSRNKRRERLHKKGDQPVAGDVVEGYVRKVCDSLVFATPYAPLFIPSSKACSLFVPTTLLLLFAVPGVAVVSMVFFSLSPG